MGEMMGRRVVNSEHENRVLMLSSTHSMQEIADLLGVAKSTVHVVQRKYHLVSRFGREHIAERHWAKNEQAWGRVLEELHVNQRLHLAEIARICGVHYSTIARRLVAIGFEPRLYGKGSVARDRVDVHARDSGTVV